MWFFCHRSCLNRLKFILGLEKDLNSHKYNSCPVCAGGTATFDCSLLRPSLFLLINSPLFVSRYISTCFLPASATFLIILPFFWVGAWSQVCLHLSGMVTPTRNSRPVTFATASISLIDLPLNRLPKNEHDLWDQDLHLALISIKSREHVWNPKWTIPSNYVIHGLLCINLGDMNLQYFVCLASHCDMR
jgi:hypothetical protein